MVYVERQKFYAAKKPENESIQDSAVKLRSISTRCQFGNQLLNILRDKFICGLYPAKIWDKMVSECKTSITF